MLGDLCGYVIVGLTLGKLGQIGAAVLVLRLILQGRTDDTLDLAPSFGEDKLAFCREGMTAALKGGRHVLIMEWLRRGTKQTTTYQQEQIALAHRQSGNIRFFGLHRGNDSVVVGHVLVGYHKLHKRIEAAALIKGRHLRRMVDHTKQSRHRVR